MSLKRPLEVSEGRPQDVGRTRLVEFNIRPCGDVLITSAENVHKTSVEDVPCRNIYDSMGTSSERYIRTSSGRHNSTSK